MSKRVVITGIHGITSLGNNWDDIYQNIQAKNTGIIVMEDWKKIDGLHSLLAAPVQDFSLPSHYTRKKIRGMGRVAKLSTFSVEKALKDADLLDQQDILSNGRTGISYGSCSGSNASLGDLTMIRITGSMQNVTATTYIKGMSHTCAVNAALTFGVLGRVIPTSSACTSSSQGIGYAYEAIKNGYQDVMIAGGAEELCVSQVAIFDTLYATSQRNDSPKTTPRPFDKDRDGLVIGEGACSFILEELSHAKARGAKIYAEVVGFGTNCDAKHVTQPTSDTMKLSLQLALDDASISPSQIGYVNAHGTATEKGDIAESQATHDIFGKNIPISSLKSYFGHTLGACGATEAWLSICMMNEKTFVPTINLENIDERCAELDYIQHNNRTIDCEYVMSNNFAFGGINTSLIFKKFS